MKKKTIFIIGILAGLLSLSAFSIKGADSSRREKARYYFLEGARMAASGNDTEAYEYYKKAYLTDTTYTEAARCYATYRFFMNTDTLRSARERERSAALIRKFVDQYPADVFESRMYAFIAERIDTFSNEPIRIYERLDSLLPPDNTTLLSLAQAYLNAGRMDDAIEVFNRIERKEGKSGNISLNKMSIMIQKGDTAAAIEEASRLIASNPKEPSFRILKGNLFEIMGENDSTLAYYTQAEELNPDFGPAKLSLANYYRERGDSIEFDNKTYEALLAEDFNLEDKLSILANYLSTTFKDKNNAQREEHLFSVLLSQYPHEAEVLDFAAGYSSMKGDYATAAQQISYAIDQDPDNDVYKHKLMQYLYLSDKPREAMKVFESEQKKILETDSAGRLPNDMRLLYAASAEAADDSDLAVRTYTEMIHEIQPDLPITDSISDINQLAALSYDQLMALNTLYTSLGDSYYRRKQIDLTFKAYDNAIKVFPDNPLTLNNYAYFSTEEGRDLDKAMEYATKAITMSPGNPTYIDTYAWVLFKKKEYEKALENQLKAFEILEENGEKPEAEYYHHLGDIYFMNHQPAKALENWEEALKLEPENALLKKKVAHKTFFFE